MTCTVTSSFCNGFFSCNFSLLATFLFSRQQVVKEQSYSLMFSSSPLFLLAKRAPKRLLHLYCTVRTLCCALNHSMMMRCMPKVVAVSAAGAGVVVVRFSGEKK